MTSLSFVVLLLLLSKVSQSGPEAIGNLMDAIDTDIAEPAREIDKPLLDVC